MGIKEPNRIRMFRERAGLSQKALATKVGTSQQQLQRIESGKQSVRYDLALRICAAINAPIGKVFPNTRSVARKLRAAASAQRVRSSNARAAPTSSALLVDATDLELWAKRLDAYARLPQLIRRLALNTLPAIERIHFRSEEGARLEGWDGIIQTPQGNAFVPAGTSGWEMGITEGVKGKADEDYDKRSAEPLSLDLANSTFVFVTPRRWSNKEKWAHTKRQEGVWKDVRVYDADDLATWLEQAPALHIWISILLGKRPRDMNDLLGFWQAWAGATQPPLSPELVLSGRKGAVDEIHKWLRGEPSAIGLQGETLGEAIAFFAATLYAIPEEERERVLSRGIVVEDAASWGQLATFDKPLILVPTFADRSTVTQAVKSGHLILIPLGKDEPALRGTIQLHVYSEKKPRKHSKAWEFTRIEQGNWPR